METFKKTKSIIRSSIIILTLSIFLIACDKNEEMAENESKTNIEESEVKTNKIADRIQRTDDNEVKKIEKKAKEELKFDFLKGRWSGKFDGRKTVMVISDLKGNSFKGKITINYRDVINQEVKGEYDFKRNLITMEDQLHSRYKGKYEGKLSSDKTVYSGKFTMKLDGKKFDFNLTKN